MPNGSLDAHLFHPERTPLLPWEQRFKILKGVASGLVYLHEEFEQVVVHRDVKASNVLLDADMGARLGDFGLPRFYERDAYPATTHIVGTLGYMAPELTITGRATTSTDVFAFGALLLEVACGRRPMEPTPSTDVNLVWWVRDWALKGELLQATDPRLEGYYDKEEVKLVLWLGLTCSQYRLETRPRMRQVCWILSDEDTLQEDAVLVFSDADSVDFFGPTVSMTWSSYGTMMAGSLHDSR